MIYWQLLGQFVVLITLLFVFNKILLNFKVSKSSFYSLFLILVLFTLGFSFRLTENENLVDLGFYFTNISFLFTYLVFTACLLLGQKKYWKVFK